MKRFGKLAVCLAGGLALNAGLRADDAGLPANPYATIVERNIFGLTPITTVVQPDQPAPPVKITPNGIMSLFGRLQVLFKTAGGPTGKEQSYILTEGQRQDDIEVTKINEKAGIVTFNNHGIVQSLPLANAPASTTAMPAAAANPFTPAGVQNRNGGPAAAIDPGNHSGRFGNFNGGRRGAGNANGGGDNSGGDSGMNLRNIPTRNGTSQSGVPTMAPEEQVIMIEAQRAKYQAEGNPMAKIFPPTQMTSQMNGDNGEDGASPPMP